jgi:hypothetical protein
MEEMAKTTNSEEPRPAVSRRNVLRNAALGGLGLAALGVGAACGGDEESAPASGQPSQARVQNFAVELGEGEIVGDVNGKEEIIGDLHRWEPAVLVAFKGDKIVLQVKNPRKHVHSFQLPAFEVDTGPLEPRTGTKTVEFVAERAGTFAFGCGAKFDEAKGICDPDHARMVGHLLVLNA